jgi:hypothetical protein
VIRETPWLRPGGSCGERFSSSQPRSSSESGVQVDSSVAHPAQPPHPGSSGLGTKPPAHPAQPPHRRVSGTRHQTASATTAPSGLRDSAPNRQPTHRTVGSPGLGPGADMTSRQGPRFPRADSALGSWARQVSNLRPLACKSWATRPALSARGRDLGEPSIAGSLRSRSSGPVAVTVAVRRESPHCQEGPRS